VLALLQRFLTDDADAIRARIPYWDDLIEYQGAFFLSDAAPTILRSGTTPPVGQSAPSPDRLSGHISANVGPGLAPAQADASVVPTSGVGTRFPARGESVSYLELNYDLPAVLPLLLKPFQELPASARKPTRLLLARSPHGEVSVIRCTDALKRLLDALTGDVSPAQVAASLGVDLDAFERTFRQLEELGAVVARESFSSSHTGSELPSPV